MCSRTESRQNYVKSKQSEAELFQLKVSWSRNARSEICEYQMWKTQIGLRPTSKGGLFSKDIFKLVLCIFKKDEQNHYPYFIALSWKVEDLFRLIFSHQIEDIHSEIKPPSFKTHKPNYEWSMTYLAWGRQGLFQIFFKVALHKRHCCCPTTYFLPFLSLLMNIIFWKFEATQTWGRRNMLRLLKTASGS